MKDIRKGRCPLCDHREVLASEAREFAADSNGAVMSVTYDARWVQTGHNAKHGHGNLWMYVCRGCGYTQWFASDPMSIPVGDEYRTTLVRAPKGEGPFR